MWLHLGEYWAVSWARAGLWWRGTARSGRVTLCHQFGQWGQWGCPVRGEPEGRRVAQVVIGPAAQHPLSPVAAHYAKYSSWWMDWRCLLEDSPLGLWWHKRWTRITLVLVMMQWWQTGSGHEAQDTRFRQLGPEIATLPPLTHITGIITNTVTISPCTAHTTHGIDCEYLCRTWSLYICIM